MSDQRFSSGYSNSEKWTSRILFLIILVANIYIFPRWSDPNQNSRLDMIVAVVDEGTFQIDHYVANTVDYAKVGEHYYSDKAPGTAFLGIPIYASIHWFFDTPIFGAVVDRLSNNSAFQQTLRADGSGILVEKVRFALLQVLLSWLLAALPTAIAGVLLFDILKRWLINPLARASLVLVYSLATPVLAYSQSLFGHQLSAALLVACLWILLKSLPQKKKWAAFLLAGFCAGYAVITEYPAVVIAILLLLYGALSMFRLKQWNNLASLAIGAALPVAGWMVYNTFIFGGPLSLGYSYSELWTVQHQTGFMSLTYPTWEAAWGISFSDYRGLFFISPILLLAFPGWLAWWQNKRERAIFWLSLGSFGLIFLFNASSIMWWGGFAVGPRYLLPGIPFLVFPLASFWERWGERTWGKIGAGILLGWSILATWGLTLAEQAFPSDTIYHPFTDFVIPNWMNGNIARNMGTILGLPSFFSLAPLAIFLLAALAGLWFLNSRRLGKPAGIPQPE